MRFARYRTTNGPRPALVAGERVYDLERLLETSGPPLGIAAASAEFAPVIASRIPELAAMVDGLGSDTANSTAMIGALEQARLLAPVVSPAKILCVGLNYADHIAEVGLGAPARPHVFAKLPSSLTGPYDEIRYPVGLAEQIDYEAELAVVIGRRARHTTPDEALTHVLGFTVVNDVSARDWQFGGDEQLTLGKGFDSFFPMGPWIVTPDELGDLASRELRCTVNGELRQRAELGTMTFDVARIISILSSICTLEPGDVIATGTPAGVGYGRNPRTFLQPGDVVVCEIDGIGAIRNRVAAVDEKGSRK